MATRLLRLQRLLPQLARLAGNEWFLTQKLSWNQTNKLPHHTFWWEGIDGSRIFTHFPPVDTYNAEFSGQEMAHAVRNYQDKGRGTRSLAPFGHGDGGGGPTREMMERARRLADLEGSAKVAIEHPDAFFAAARAEYPDAPVWSGELYLELHRATYTSQARTKQGNRRSEHALREAELWAATAALHTDFAYPYERLDRLWKTVLLHQFHDILPGSSIAWVHREAEEEYARIAEELTEITTAALTALNQARPAIEDRGPGRSPGHGKGRAGGGTAGGGPYVFNAGPRPRAEVVIAPAGTANGQPLSDGTIAVYAEIPASGSAPWKRPRPHTPSPSTASLSTTASSASSWPRTAPSPPYATWSPTARSWPPAPAISCGCTAICPIPGTPGTSTGTTSSVSPICATRGPSASPRTARCSAPCASSGSSAGARVSSRP